MGGSVFGVLGGVVIAGGEIFDNRLSVFVFEQELDLLFHLSQFLRANLRMLLALFKQFQGFFERSAPAVKFLDDLLKAFREASNESFLAMKQLPDGVQTGAAKEPPTPIKPRCCHSPKTVSKP